jgi:hypothetical protein
MEDAMTVFFLSSVLAMGNLFSSAISELSCDDFNFKGSLGSQGAVIEKIGEDHFKVTLGHAPEHPDWCNMLQFQIERNAKGKSLRLDVFFHGGNAYRFNSYSYSWSYDGKNWRPIHWKTGEKDSGKGDTLIFPTFTEDRVYFGHQVPMSYEDMVEIIRKWEKKNHIKTHIIGQSLEKRDIYRVEITNPESAHPRNERWVHYFANQHPGEHNSQWRMVGMVEYLLRDEAAEYRERNICHFIIMMSPDAPSHGWYRVNAQGVDMNRSYRVEGADPKHQAHEAYICQKDLEMLMDSESPVTDIWSMHTWGGIVEPICTPGPEMGTKVGPWTELRDIMEGNDPDNLIKPLKIREKEGGDTYWTSGPHRQFGITAVLCEGAGGFYTKQENLDSGAVLMKSILMYYRGIKR